VLFIVAIQYDIMEKTVGSSHEVKMWIWVDKRVVEV